MSSEADSAGNGGDSGGYVHVPDEPNAAIQSNGDAADDLGRKGWVLVGVVAFATLVLPGLIYLYPQFLSDHVSFMVAMLAFPFLPALLLGGIAVWSMTESGN